MLPGPEPRGGSVQLLRVGADVELNNTADLSVRLRVNYYPASAACSRDLRTRHELSPGNGIKGWRGGVRFAKHFTPGEFVGSSGGGEQDEKRPFRTFRYTQSLTRELDVPQWRIQEFFVIGRSA